MGLSRLLKYSEEICERFCLLNLSCWYKMNNCVKMKLDGSSCTHYKPYVIYQLPLLWEEGGSSGRERREEKREERKMEEQGVASETGREEKLLNDETICAVKRLDQTSTNGRTSSMATGSVTKRKAAISLNTPIFFSPFSLSRPPSFPQLQGPVYLSLDKHK